MTIKKYSKFNSFKEEEKDSPWYDVDLSPLEKEIKKIIGESVTLKIQEVSKRGSKVFVPLKNDKNLASKAGIMSVVYDTLFVQSFNSTVSLKESGLSWWIQMDFRYKYNKIAGGGSNGATFLTAWYDFNTEKWKFQN